MVNENSNDFKHIKEENAVLKQKIAKAIYVVCSEYDTSSSDNESEPDLYSESDTSSSDSDMESDLSSESGSSSESDNSSSDSETESDASSKPRINRKYVKRLYKNY